MVIPHRRASFRRFRLLAAAMLALLAACGREPDTGAVGGGDDGTTGTPVTLRLGYFPNITHATGLVGVRLGIFADALGSGVRLEAKNFNAARRR